MKKLILTAALTAATALSGFSQGQIIYQNSGVNAGLYFTSSANASNKVSNATIGAQTGTSSSAVVDVGLYWSTAAFTDAAQGTLAEMVGMSTTQAGAIAGGTIVLPGTASGQQVYVQVFAWDSTYASFAAAVANNGWAGAWSAGAANTTYGAIGAAELTTGLTVSPAPGTPIFGTGAGQFGKCVLLQNTPEPATLALGGLGAAALLMFRRRK
jgi:hypothetical protein